MLIRIGAATAATLHAMRVLAPFRSAMTALIAESSQCASPDCDARDRLGNRFRILRSDLIH
jgi:hypothetical protein